MAEVKTKSQIIEKLNELTVYDQEISHKEADFLLLDALIIAGMDDVVNAYLKARERVGFWYA